MTKPLPLSINETSEKHEFDKSVLLNQFVEPKVIIVARVAAKPLGYVGYLNEGPSLHLSILIKDFNGYSTIGFDGQPTIATKPALMEFKQALKEAILDSKDVKGLSNQIQTNFYYNEEPSGTISKRITIPTPKNVTPKEFAFALVNAASNFQSYTTNYSFPKKITGDVMKEGEYNSSSYVAGLFNYVLGYVPPEIHFEGYQTPGLENPLPSHLFRSGPNGEPK